MLLFFAMTNNAVINDVGIIELSSFCNLIGVKLYFALMLSFLITNVSENLFLYGCQCFFSIIFWGDYCLFTLIYGYYIF